MANFDLSGKIALVTGGAHGIGFTLGCALAEHGATLCFNCSSKGSYERGVAAYKKAGVQAHGFVCDVSDETAVNSIWDFPPRVISHVCLRQ